MRLKNEPPKSSIHQLVTEMEKMLVVLVHLKVTVSFLGQQP